MIAIIAAVPLETELLRRALSPCEVRNCGHLDLFRGSLEGHPLVLLHCGIGKANAAAGATVLLETERRPRALINIGCGGAYPESGLTLGDLALASAELYGDEGVAAVEGFLDMEALNLPLAQHHSQRFYNRFPVDEELLQRTRELLQEALADSGHHLAVGPFVTVSTCSGTTAAGLTLGRRTGGICENMEGAAIAQICLRYDVPFLEIRGISNLTEDRDPGRWDLKAGAEAAQQAVRTLLARWYRQKDLA